MQIIKFNLNDRILMKKKHPCGSFVFKVMRVGSDIRILCEGCKRDLTLPRITLEKSVKKILESDTQEN